MTTSRIPTTEPIVYPPDEPYYYQNTPITARIMPLLIAVERALVSAYAAGVLLALGCFLVGWYARGLWGPVWDNRGWAALVVFSIVGSTWMVNERNRGR